MKKWARKGSKSRGEGCLEGGAGRGGEGKGSGRRHKGGTKGQVFWREYLLGRTHFGAGEESRAKDAKDAKDAKGRGMEDEEIAGVVEEGAFALRIQMPWR